MFVWGAYAASGAGFGGFTETIFHLTTRLRHVVVRLRRGRRIHTNGFADVMSLHRRRFVPSRSEDEGSALSISELRWDSGLSSAKKAAGTFFVCRLVSNARWRLTNRKDRPAFLLSPNVVTSWRPKCDPSSACQVDAECVRIAFRRIASRHIEDPPYSRRKGAIELSAVRSNFYFVTFTSAHPQAPALVLLMCWRG